MSYTEPNGQPQGFPYYFTNKIREALIAELIAINGYAEHIANSNMESINMVWSHIMQDEKDHYGQFLSLLRKYDPVQYQMYQTHARDKIEISPMQTYKPNYDKQLILNNVREDIKGEFEAVLLYEQHLIEMPYQDIRDVFSSIANTEKEHSEHLTRLLIKYDSDKYDDLK